MRRDWSAARLKDENPDAHHFRTVLRIAILLVLCGVTIAFAIVHDPYEATGPNRLRNSDFSAEFDSWTISPPDAVTAGIVAQPDGTVTLMIPPERTRERIEVRQNLSFDSERLLILSAEISTRNVMPGEKPWETARVLLVPMNPDGTRRYDVPHSLASLEGSKPWAQFTQIFRIPDENTEAAVVIQVLNATGTLEVRSLSLHAAHVAPGYSRWRNALVLVWFAVAPWVAWPLLRVAHARPGGKLVIGIACIVLVGVLTPASVKYWFTPSWLLPESEAPGPFRADLLPTAVPFRFDVTVADGAEVYKAAHFLLFAILGYLLRARRPFRASLWTQFWLVGLFALATEAAQTLATGRGGSFGDVLVDMAGVTVGMLVTRTRAVGSRTDSR